MVNIFVYTLGIGLSIYVLSISIFWMVPLSGPAVSLAFSFLCLAIMIECALSKDLPTYFVAVPVAAGLVMGILAYNFSGVALMRSTYFSWPRSGPLRFFNMLVSSLLASGMMVTGITYFAFPDHNNPLAMMVSKLSPTQGTCDRTDSVIVSASVVVGFFGICLTRTKEFEKWMHMAGLKFYVVHTPEPPLSNIASSRTSSAMNSLPSRRPSV